MQQSESLNPSIDTSLSGMAFLEGLIMFSGFIPVLTALS